MEIGPLSRPTVSPWSFGVLGSRLPGLRILDPGGHAVAKTYRTYWRDATRARPLPRTSKTANVLACCCTELARKKKKQKRVLVLLIYW